MGSVQSTIPSEVVTILEWWTPRITTILRAKLRSLTLFGSVTLGDFMPGWSDVDVCVVVGEPVTAIEHIQIERMHAVMRDRFIHYQAGGWQSGQAIEAVYLPTGVETPWTVTQSIPPFDRYLLAHAGIRIAGERVAFAPPTRNELVAQTQQELWPLIEPAEGCLEDPIWLAGMLQWLARTIAFWRDGTLLSKTVALQREIAAGSPFTDAYALTLRLRREGSAAAHAHYTELREAFCATAPPAAGLLSQLVEE